MTEKSMLPDDWFDLSARYMGERADIRVQALNIDCAIKGLSMLTEQVAEATELDTGSVVCLLASRVMEETDGRNDRADPEGIL